MMNLEEVYVL